MASRFVLTAQVQLQAPTNTRQVVNEIQRQLKGVKVDVNMQGGQQASKQINNINKAAKEATTQANKMGKAFGSSIRRFGAFTIATRAVSLFTSGLANATKEAIDFQREIVKISQVTGKSVAQLKGLENTITDLATSLGVSSKSILSVGRILAQAGIKAGDLEVALKALAKTSLAPTFEDITKTAEGAVAVLAQFGEGVGALERQLGAINAVAGQFAVESGDLISAVRRFGGVFRAASGELEELLALFTSVRATTRESAESIATGLRTIFTRIQRPATIGFLKQFGVELTDLSGKFVGPYEAVRQLSEVLSGLERGDIRFVQIAEQLGGFRQIGKVIPLLQQFEVAERARQAAIEGGNSLSKDAATAQQALAVQITKVKEEFLALIRSFAESSSFNIFVKSSLELASALIKIADALKPLLPLLATFGALKFAKGAAGFARGIGSGLKGGNKAGGFARGGVVPGTGNRDTVPAMLTPGEFVIKKSSVGKLGAGNLAQMNDNKYALGGSVGAIGLNPFGGKGSTGKGTVKTKDVLTALVKNTNLAGGIGGNARLIDSNGTASKLVKNKGLADDLFNAVNKEAFGQASVGSKQQTFTAIGATFPRTADDESSTEDLIKQKIRSSFTDIVKSGGIVESLQSSIEAGGGPKVGKGRFNSRIIDSIGIEDSAGKIFEASVSRMGAPFKQGGGKSDGDDFDFIDGVGGNLAQFAPFAPLANIPTDAKKTLTKNILNEIADKKTKNTLAAQVNQSPAFQKVKKLFASTKVIPKTKRASGGGISGSDTVPAMLTPGEFVVNKGAASSIGMGNLNRMNKHGVTGFAAGGVVTTGRNNYGVMPAGVNANTGESAESIMTRARVASVIPNSPIGKDVGVKKTIEEIKKLGEASAESADEIDKKNKEDKKGKKEKMDMAGMVFAASAMAAMVPDFEDADDGLKALANESKKSAMKLGMVAMMAGQMGVNMGGMKGARMNVGFGAGLDADGNKVGIGSKLKVMAGVAVVAAAAVSGLTSMMDAYTGVKKKAKDAEENAIKTGSEADIQKAQSAAANVRNQNAINKAGMGLTAGLAGAGLLLGGPFGAAIGGAVGALVTLGSKTESGRKVLDSLLSRFGGLEGAMNSLASFGIGSTSGQAKEQIRLTIESARAQTELAEAAKDAKKELEEIKAGRLSATGSLGAGGAAARAAGALGKRGASADRLVKENEAQISSIESSGIGSFVNMLTGTTGKLETQNKQLKEQKIKSGQDFLASQGSRFAAATKEQTVMASASGGTATFDQFLKGLDPSIVALVNQTDKLNDNSDEMDKLKKNFENQRKATLENVKFIKAMNFGLSEVTSGIKAYSSSLNNLVATQETGFTTSAVAAETLATAISSAGKFISSSQLGQSLDLLEDNLKRFGANASQITDAKALITGLNDVQKGASDALKAVKAGFKGGSASPETIKNQLRDSILGSIPDSSPIKQKLLDSFGNLEIPPEAITDFLNTGDVSGILDQAFGPIQEQIEKQLLGPLKEMAEQEKILVSLTKQRREAEQKYIQVQRIAIDAQIDAAKTFQEFGGAAFTPERELAARRDQASLVLRDAGVGGLNGGSASDIRAASDEIFSKFSSQQALQNQAASGGSGAFGGVAGVDRDRRQELNQSNQALLTFTKQSIEARKKELELIQKKNQAEKDSLQSLLSGDIESFFDQAIGSAAGSALRTGDSQVAGLFGAGALGKGLQGLQGTGLSDDKNQRAAGIAFGAFGLGDRAAKVFSGTTSEEEKIKSEGRGLALLQGELAGQSADMARMDVEAKEVVINAANVRMTEVSNRVSSAQSAISFNRGGAVYANRGMFVPRGTDTVPAMLTPGEFVVNRAAVARGNNMQVLRAMNGGMGNGATNSAGTSTMNRGGIFGRRNGSDSSPQMPDLSPVFDKFSEAVDKLAGLNISVKLDPTNVNVNFNGTSFLANLKEEIRNELLTEVANQIPKTKFTESGEMRSGDGFVTA